MARYKESRMKVRAVKMSNLQQKAEWWNGLSDEEKAEKKKKWEKVDWEKKASKLSEKMRSKFKKNKDGKEDKDEDKDDDEVEAAGNE